MNSIVFSFFLAFIMTGTDMQSLNTFMDRASNSFEVLSSQMELEKIEPVDLGSFPSPIIACKELEKQFLKTNIYIKHDGLSNPTQISLGGNKLRKLAYILAEAQAQKVTSLITFGCAGSNHALQTTICAQQLGMTSYCLLLDQENNASVRRNLLLQEAYGGKLIHFKNRSDRTAAAVELFLRLEKEEGKKPYIIPTGGSSPLGTLGYVDAATELKRQIERGLLPQPDRIYIPVGSAGIAAGLLLGLQLQNNKAHVYCVLTEPDDKEHTLSKKIEKLFCETETLLRSYNKNIPEFSYFKNKYTIVTEYTGTDYGVTCPKASEALDIMYKYESITLDTTYSAKCFAALLNDLRSGSCDNQTVLFWNTYCSELYNHITDKIDYKKLPKEFHSYFINSKNA